MTMPVEGGRVRRDLRGATERAAIRVLDEGVTMRDAQAGFGIGRTRLAQAIAKLRAERAAQAKTG